MEKCIITVSNSFIQNHLMNFTKIERYFSWQLKRRTCLNKFFFSYKFQIKLKVRSF